MPIDDRDPHIAQMRDGTVVCSFFTRAVDPQTKEPPCVASIVTSPRWGKTWDEKAQTVADGWPWLGASARAGRWDGILGVYGAVPDEPRPSVGRPVNRRWKDMVEAIPIGKGSGVELDAETDVITLKDGLLFAALRSPKRCTSPTAQTRGRAGRR